MQKKRKKKNIGAKNGDSFFDFRIRNFMGKEEEEEGKLGSEEEATFYFFFKSARGEMLLMYTVDL